MFLGFFLENMWAHSDIWSTNDAKTLSTCSQDFIISYTLPISTQNLVYFLQGRRTIARRVWTSQNLQASCNHVMHQRVLQQRSNYGGLRVAQKVKCPAEVDEDLRLRLCPRIEAFAADSAADEQLAARELQSGLAGPSIPPILDSLFQFFSNLKVREEFFVCIFFSCAWRWKVSNRDRARTVQRPIFLKKT